MRTLGLIVGFVVVIAAGIAARAYLVPGPVDWKADAPAPTGPITSAPVGKTASTALATTTPVDDVGPLLRRLDGPDHAAAEQQLIDRGSSVFERLKSYREQETDPELKLRATALITEIHARSERGATPITLHLKSTGGTEAVAAIEKQTWCSIVGIGPTAGGPADARTVTIDADREPFWPVLTDVCRQLGVCPVLEPPRGHKLRLFPSARSWITDAPHQIVGPFWVGVAGVYRSESVDLTGPVSTDRRFTVKMIVYPEPKLACLAMSKFEIESAVDDTGRSLAPPGRRAGIEDLDQPVTRTLDVPLVYVSDQGAGRRIAILRGGLIMTVADGVRTIELRDPLGASPTEVNPVEGCTVQMTVRARSADTYELQLECDRIDLPDEQWFALVDHTADVDMLDGAGQAFLPMTWTAANDNTPGRYRATGVFSRASFTGATLGRPSRVTWPVASRFVQMPVNVEFRDLPIP